MTLYLHRRQQPRSRRSWWRGAFSLLAAVLLAFGPAFGLQTGGGGVAPAFAEQSTLDIESNNTGAPINGQDGWSALGAAGSGCAVYDHQFTAVPPAIQSLAPGFGSKAFRASNSVTSGCFSDQTFTKPLVNETGETSATSNGQSSGVRSAFFEAEWDFISAEPTAEQVGLGITVSPDRGDGARMSWIRMEDKPTGIDVLFNDYQHNLVPTPDFVQTTIATGLNRGASHHIKVTIVFVDGIANDILRVFVDGNLVHTGTTWEDYFRDQEANPTRTVDSLLFRSSGTAQPALAGKGFFFDNIKLTGGLTSVFVRADGSDTACDGTADASVTGSGVCAVQTVARGAQLAAASGATVSVGPGTYSEATIQLPAKSNFILKGAQAGNRPTIVNGIVLGSGSTVTLQDLILNGGDTAQYGIASHASVTGLTVKNVTITDYVNDGVFMDGASALSTILFEDVESSSNGRHGFYITPNAGQTVTDFTLRRVIANSNNVAPAASLSGRGAWFINGTKTNITVEDSTFNNNRLVGLDLSEGNVANAVITGNTASGNGDSGIGILGPKTAMTVANNTVTNNGRFGIEIKNPDGLTSGTPTLVVNGNTVSRTVAATDLRDHAGILVMRRGPQAPANVDQPAGVLIQNNVVSGFRANAPGSTGDGFCIVVEGTNMVVQNNAVSDCDVGIQAQKGNTANTQSTIFFDRGDANSFSGTVHNNSIASSNTTGARAAGLASALDATSNWWGSSSGPSHASNTSPNGAVVSDTVTFSPFLTRGTDTSASIGFQPDTAPITTAFVRTDGSSTECDGSANAAFSGGALGACAVASVQKGVNNVQAGGTVSVGAGTFVGANAAVSTSKSVTIQGASRATTILDGLVTGVKTESHGIQFTSGVGATVKDLTVKRFNWHGIFFGSFSGPNVGPANVTVDNVESSDNGDVGQAPGTAAGSARGIVVWDGAKTNITITNSIANNNSLVGIDINDGSVANAIITGNTVSGNRDAGIGVLGPKTAMTVANNTVTDNGRFGIEIKNPDGLTSGTQTLVVEGNTVSRTVAATDLRDHAGILVMRRGPSLPINVDQPAGVLVQNNAVTGFRANAPGTTGDGFCIVVEGVNMTVKNNSVANCDVGIQMQKGNTANTQNTQFFDRGDAADYSGITELNDVATTNTTGIRGVGLTAAANATRNWWGVATGPTNANNPSGTGATLVGTNISFSPWLGDGTDTSGSVGFQPNVTLVALNTQGINVTPTSGLTTTENGGTAQFAIVLASQPTANVTVGLSSSNTNEGTVSPSSLTFTPANWNVPQTATVTGVSAGAPNGNAAYTIVTAAATSSDPLFNGINPSDVSVTNSAAATPSISVADATVTEGDGTPVQMVFNVTLSQAHTRTVTVNYATTAGTATASSDFVMANGTLSFAPGETTKTIPIQVIGDLAFEGTSPETLTVTLTNPTEATLARAQATGGINEDDIAFAASTCGPRPNISVTTQAIGARQMQVTVRVDNAAPNASNVLSSIQFGTPTNATIQMVGQSSIGSSPIALASGTRQITFIVQQTNANASFYVPFKVTDSCGGVDKFVGGGANSIN